MKNQIGQPLPQTGPLPGKENLEEAVPPKGNLGRLFHQITKLVGNPQKAKLILILLIVAAALFILLFFALLVKKPQSQPSPGIQPAPTPQTTQPIPTSPATEDDIDALIDDIEKFDPNQQDLQPPVVDLTIGL